ncbi:MAG: alanine racemase [Acidobacteriaceae bacterium]
MVPNKISRRPIWAEVSSGCLCANFRLLRASMESQAGESQAGSAAEVLAVVKADAYGHGAVGCAPLLAAAGARWLGVTSVEEGVQVREACAGASADASPNILVMCGLWDGEAAALVEHSLTPVVWESFHLDLIEMEAGRRGLERGSLPVHVEIDTGMARQGVAADHRLVALLKRFTPDSALRLEGVLTHFASAEVVDSRQNSAQMTILERALTMVAEHGLRPLWIHAGSSSTLDAGIELPHIAKLALAMGARPMARPGLALYGYSLPLESYGERTSPPRTKLRNDLQPVLTWKTRIVSLREIGAGSTIGYGGTFAARQPMRLALLPVGYADGLRRELSCSDRKPGGWVLIRGRRAPIVGRVSMDLTIVDVSAIAAAALGDEAILIGQQENQSVTADDHARLAATIPYEILCGISDRVPRVIV